MTQIDLASLLHPISEDAPCGGDLEYDPAFGELERSAQRTPERVMGTQVIAAEDPDWSDVLEKSLALFERTKDLRVAAQLLHAGLKTGGLPAFASGVALVHRLVSDYWDSVHPQLDKEDNNDPTLRMNSLLLLDDRTGVVASLSRCPLVSSRTLGRFSMRDIRIAGGEMTPHDGEDAAKFDPALIDAAFLDGDLDELQANAEAVQAALDSLKALSAFLIEQVGSYAPELGALTAELQAMRHVLVEQLGRRGAAPAGGNGAGVLAGALAAASGAPGDIRSRDDVIRTLDRICDYFQKHEPSSPVPLLLKRAKRLVAKDFMDILRDLTPDGVSQAELIGGLDKED